MTFARQLLVDLLVPPIAAALMWVGGTAWLNVVYGGDLTEGAKKMRKVGTLVVLVLCWVMMFGIALYAHFTGWRYHP